MPESWTKKRKRGKQEGREGRRGIGRQRTEEWCTDFREAAH